MQKKYIVSFTYINSFPPQRLGIDPVSSDRVNSLIRKLSRSRKIPDESCIYTITFHCRSNKTLPLNRLTKSTTPSLDNELEVHFTTTPHCKCPIEECLQNLAAGKCTDKFMIENIGKQFFKDKYQDKHTKQR